MGQRRNYSDTFDVFCKVFAFSFVSNLSEKSEFCFLLKIASKVISLPVMVFLFFYYLICLIVPENCFLIMVVLCTSRLCFPWFKNTLYVWSLNLCLQYKIGWDKAKLQRYFWCILLSLCFFKNLNSWFFSKNCFCIKLSHYLWIVILFLFDMFDFTGNRKHNTLKKSLKRNDVLVSLAY